MLSLFCLCFLTQNKPILTKFTRYEKKFFSGLSGLIMMLGGLYAAKEKIQEDGSSELKYYYSILIVFIPLLRVINH